MNNQRQWLATLGTQDTGAIKNEQSETMAGNIGYSRHRGNQE